MSAPDLLTFAKIPSRNPTSFLPPRVSLLAPYICALPSLLRIIDVKELLAVPMVLAVENFPLSVAVMSTVPAPRSPMIEIPLLEMEIAVIKIGAVALSVKVPIREPVEEIFHKVRLFNSFRSAGTCSTTTPSTLTGALVAL